MLNDSFPLPETGSGTDLDSKLNGYIALCKTCSYCTDSDSDPYSIEILKHTICTVSGRESESVSLSECVSSNVNERI